MVALFLASHLALIAAILSMGMASDSEDDLKAQTASSIKIARNI